MRSFALSLVVANSLIAEGTQSNANPAGNLQKARGLQAALYHEVSGFRYLEIKYSEIKKEHPKLGFFRLGLPVLKVTDLELNLYPEKASYEKLREKIQGLAESKGTRFILGEPTVLRVISEKKTKIEIKAGRIKMNADGILKCYNGVSVKFGETTRETKFPNPWQQRNTHRSQFR